MILGTEFFGGIIESLYFLLDAKLVGISFRNGMGICQQIPN